MNRYLRKKCKLIKSFNNITYKQMAKEIGIKEDSFYNWIKERYDLGTEKQQLLYNYVIKTRPQEDNIES